MRQAHGSWAPLAGEALVSARRASRFALRAACSAPGRAERHEAGRS